jgi:hypothetical protein
MILTHLSYHNNVEVIFTILQFQLINLHAPKNKNSDAQLSDQNIMLIQIFKNSFESLFTPI